MKTLCTYLFIVFFGFGFFACSDDDDISTPEIPEEIEEVNSMNAFIPLKNRPLKEKKDLLGYGYDITATYLSYESAREPIIDIARFKEEEKGRYHVSGATESSSYSARGITPSDYIKDLTFFFNRNNNENKLPDDISAFSGTLLDNEVFNIVNDPDSDNYSYGSSHVYWIYKRFYLNTYPDILHSYLSEAFKKDISDLSSEKIIQKYGTHLIVDYSIGGRFDMIYRSKINLKNFTLPTGETIIFDYEKKQILKAGMRHAASKIGFWYNGEITTPEEEIVKKNKIPIVHIVNQGGDSSLIPSGTYNLQKEYPKIDIVKWFDSVNGENAVLIEINFKYAYPIWELINDTEKQTELKTAIEQYIKERQIPTKK